MQPTPEAYSELEAAYIYFNQTLFDGALPPCLITLQREKRTLGFFSAARFVRRTGEQSDEIAINPSYFAIQPVDEVLSTLVHEMAHLWQLHFGRPGRGRYHNAEWAAKMETLGLMPSDTDREGGRRVGDRVGHYIIPGGPFALACEGLVTQDFTLSWLDRFPPYSASLNGQEEEDLEGRGIEVQKAPKNRSNRLKYTCPGCGANAWGKPNLAICCAACPDGPRFEGAG